MTLNKACSAVASNISISWSNLVVLSISTKVISNPSLCDAFVKTLLPDGILIVKTASVSVLDILFPSTIIFCLYWKSLLPLLPQLIIYNLQTSAL